MQKHKCGKKKQLRKTNRYRQNDAHFWRSWLLSQRPGAVAALRAAFGTLTLDTTVTPIIAGAQAGDRVDMVGGDSLLNVFQWR